MPSRSNMTQFFGVGELGLGEERPARRSRRPGRRRGSARRTPRRPASSGRPSGARARPARRRRSCASSSGIVPAPRAWSSLDRAAVDRGQEADLLALDRLRPAVLAEAAAAALRVRDVDVGPLVGEARARSSARAAPASARRARARRGRRRSRPSRSGPAGRRAGRPSSARRASRRVWSCKHDVVADAAVQLRVADRPLLAGGEHEVGVADDLDLAAGERGPGPEGALVDDALALARGARAVACSCSSRGSSATSTARGKRSRCRRLVVVAEVEEHLAEGVGRLLLEAVASRASAQVAAARLEQVVEGARGDPGISVSALLSSGVGEGRSIPASAVALTTLCPSPAGPEYHAGIQVATWGVAPPRATPRPLRVQLPAKESAGVNVGEVETDHAERLRTRPPVASHITAAQCPIHRLSPDQVADLAARIRPFGTSFSGLGYGRFHGGSRVSAGCLSRFTRCRFRRRPRTRLDVFDHLLRVGIHPGPVSRSP